MLASTSNEVLPGMEDLHFGLRECTCECGCGEHFFQTKVGRVRKYIDAKHKAQAYRNRKAQAANKARIGDVVCELVKYTRGEYVAGEGLAWMTDVERGAIMALFDMAEIELFCDGLNALAERYC